MEEETEAQRGQALLLLRTVVREGMGGRASAGVSGSLVLLICSLKLFIQV